MWLQITCAAAASPTRNWISASLIIHSNPLNNVAHGNKKTSRLVVVAVRRDGDGSAAKVKGLLLSQST